MGKRCECSAVLEAVERHPALITLPLATRMVWLLLVRQMQGLGQSALVLGSEVLNLSGIAALIRIEQPEMETQIEPLLRREMLRWRADGALECPMLVAAATRAQTSRINGLKGGRPRKATAPPGQTHLMMGIAGGAACAAAETQPETFSRTAEAKLVASQEGSKLAAAGATDLTQLGAELAELVGMDQARGMYDYQPVRRWLSAGATPDLLRHVLGEVAGRAGFRSPRNLAYFDAPVREAMEAGITVAPPSSPERQEAARAYLAAVAVWERAGKPGPAPVYPHAQVAA